MPDRRAEKLGGSGEANALWLRDSEFRICPLPEIWSKTQTHSVTKAVRHGSVFQ